MRLRLLSNATNMEDGMISPEATGVMCCAGIHSLRTGVMSLMVGRVWMPGIGRVFLPITRSLPSGATKLTVGDGWMARTGRIFSVRSRS